ncbi:DUF5686 family protein [Arcicella sp. LKC2W]|uniref:DUF5686 and carboxypeptidase-like regulatory domain-containing protein n=1 Tax=Arcicella sp. LKC2W TaxID=2984198 RepID=UPI002B214D87|nr:DUF5686 family protein [Arcicella sp. LKC2W]MEA5459319.1 DUF5686 family protein [Arcicella sp. LKC2W]
MKKLILLLIVLHTSINIKAQVISGQVFDSRTKEPLPFVSVSVKNTTKGVLSHEDGRFSITVNNKDTELIFSSIGYFPKVIKAVNANAIYLEEKDNQLSGVTVHYINPAHRIIESAIKNKPFNDPENYLSFKYEVYHKSIVTADIDSLNANKKLGKILQNNDLFVNESYATRHFIRPNLSKEIVVASRTSGTKSTLFTSLTPLLQQFGFYRDFIQFQGRQLSEQLIYVNPLATGAINRYDFDLIDTLITEIGDSTFVIEFAPQKNSNFEGLKGVLHIHSDNFALQYVEAEPAEKGLLNFKLEQVYEKNGETNRWFPKDLSAEWLLSEFKIGGQSLRFNIRSSIKNVELDVPILASYFDENALEIKPDAIYQDDNFWKNLRPDSLSVREKNTFLYHKSMSLAKKFKQTAILNASEWFVAGMIPLSKKLDLSIQNLFDANVYEGIRPTFNVLTNENFSKIIRLDAKVGYGFNDKAFKYEGRIRLTLSEKLRMRLSLQYRSDISEPGNVQFFIWNSPQIPYELIRTFQIAKADSLKQMKAELTFKALKYGVVSVSFTDEYRNPTYKYKYHNPMHDPASPMMDDFHTTEIGVGIRYAFGEQFSQVGRGSIITTLPSPIFALHLAQGVLYFPEGKTNYTKLNARVEYTLNTPSFGQTFLHFTAGKTWGEVPYPYLYNGRGGKAEDGNLIWVANHFNTMGLYEFTSDQYTNLFVTHSFGSLLSKPNIKWFRPDVSVFQGIAFGNFNNNNNAHEGIDFKTLEKGYFESGLMVDNLYRKRIMKLFYVGAGIGVFRRWGANELSNNQDNWAYRLVWNVRF